MKSINRSPFAQEEDPIIIEPFRVLRGFLMAGLVLLAFWAAWCAGCAILE